MGFMNFSKPGPGVDKNAPKKKGIFLYFELFFRKFGKIIASNALYCLISVPLLLFLYIFAPVGLMEETVKSAADGDTYILIMMALRMAFAFGIFILWGSGPASAAYAYITRCFTREEHVWIISDGKDKFKENFKQSIVVVIVDILVLFLGLNAVMFYHSSYALNQSLIWMVAEYMTVLMLMVYTMMHYYIYQIMVTFECTIPQLYKNSLLLALGKLPYNILLSIFAVVMIGVFYLILSPYLSIILSFVIVVAFVRFPIEFMAARTISKTITDMNRKKQSAKKQYIEQEQEQEQA